MADELSTIVDFVHEIGLLKRYKRTGWLIVGVNNPESIAEHSFRTAIIGTILAAVEGADPARTALLCLFHDTQETRLTDIPYIGKEYVKPTANSEVTADQVGPLPEPVASLIQNAVTEYEDCTSVEARCAADADKLECLMQALEYREQGHQNVQPWIDTSVAALQTLTAKQLAEAALTSGSLDWLSKALDRPRRQQP